MSTNFLKIDSNTGVSCGYCKILKNSFLKEHLWWLLLTVLYCHVTKQLFPCLKWLVTCFRFQKIFWKNISCFRFWWKTYIKRCTSNYVISRVKDILPLHFAVGQVLSISGYDLENGRMLCKQKYWIKNMAIKIPILILFRFCLL